MKSEVDLVRLLPHVVAAAEAGGRQIAAEFVRPNGPRGSGEHADVDDEIEASLRVRLLDLLPVRWRGEETGVLVGDGGPYCWVVDPHDGTRGFLEGERGSAVSIALLRDGVPVLGVVHAPLSPDRGADTIAWAEGLGDLVRNGLAVSSPLTDGRLSAGQIVFVSQAAPQWPVGNARAVSPARFVGLPGIAYRLARVAAGDGVGAVSLNGPCGWDYAAGHALLRGAGGVLLDEAGRDVVYTIDGKSNTGRCFGGGRAVALELVGRDWNGIQKSGKIPRRTVLTWPRAASGAALERAVGCMLGQVIGDSLGALVEFESLAQIHRRYPDGVRELADGGTWNTFAGQPTDDSELALDLARTLVGRKWWSAEAVAEAYGKWKSSKPFDVGNTIGKALSAAAVASTDKAGAARAAASRDSQANGALMRCASIGIWARDPKEAAVTARADALLSHPHPVCQAASAAYAAAIATGIAGGDPEAMCAAAAAAMPEPEAAQVRDCLALARRGEGPEDLTHNQGWVLLAFQNAFWHLAKGTPIEQALIETVGKGGDTDTNAAICGALLGAAQGSVAIPVRWTMAVLSCRPLLEMGAGQPRPARYWPDDLTWLAEGLLMTQGMAAENRDV